MTLVEIQKLWKESLDIPNLNDPVGEFLSKSLFKIPNAKRKLKLHHRDIIQNLLIEIQTLQDKIEYSCKCHEETREG